MNRLPLTILLSAILVGTLVPFAHAEPTTSDLGWREVAPLPTDADTQTRLDYIVDIIEREERKAKWWSFGWQAAFGGIMLGQATWALATNDIATQRERAVGAGAASIGFFTQFMSWLPSRHGSAEILAMDVDPQVQLQFAEEVLYDGYQKQRFVRGVLSHLGSLLVAGSSSMIIWRVWGYGKKAAINFPIALSVGQARVWSQPIYSLRGWQAYQKGIGKQARVQPKVRFGLRPRPDGLELALSF